MALISFLPRCPSPSGIFSRAKLPLAVFAALLFSPLASALPQTELRAKQVALQWLEGMDAGRYAEAWEQTAPEFRSSIPLAQWLEQIRKARPQLGAVEQRTLKRLFFTHQLPEAPLGNYVVIEFETRFAGSGSALREIVTPVWVAADGRLLAPQALEDSAPGAAWQVCGYYIFPPRPAAEPVSAPVGEPPVEGNPSTEGN